MATLSAYLPAAEAVGVYAVLDECARRAGIPGDERGMDARRSDALVDLVLGDRFPPRWPGISPPGVPGGASSPTHTRAARWTTAPPATGRLRTLPS